MKSKTARGVLKRLLTTMLTAVVIAAGLAVAQPAQAKKGDKTIQYTFNFVNGTTISGTASDNTVFLAGAGGSSVDNPTGMDVHVSCSDDFPGGWGEKDGPVQGVDTAWQIASYSIAKMKGDKVDKTCGDAFTPPVPEPVADPPAIDIEKYVNGDDADQPKGPQIAIGSPARFTYRVQNTGGVALQNVNVTDSILGNVECPKTTLAVDEIMWCSPRQVQVDNAGQFQNSADVTAVARVTVGNPSVIDKGYGYSFTFVNGVTISGSNSKNTVFVPNAGGTSVQNPTGMEMHISCSDDFPGGWGEKDGPVRGVDTAWQIASYTINKYKNGKVDKTCGQTFVEVERPVSDTDPVNYFAKTAPEPPQPPVDVCDLDVVNGTPVLSWNEVDGAAKYAIWRNGQWIGQTKDTSFTDTNAPANAKASYQLRVIFTNGTKGPKVDCGEVTPPPQPPTPPTFSCELSTKNGAPMLSWNQVDDAKRYAIWRNGEWVDQTKALSFVDIGADTYGTLSYQVRVVFDDGTKGPLTDCGTIKNGS